MAQEYNSLHRKESGYVGSGQWQRVRQCGESWEPKLDMKQMKSEREKSRKQVIEG